MKNISYCLLGLMIGYIFHLATFEAPTRSLYKVPSNVGKYASVGDGNCYDAMVDSVRKYNPEYPTYFETSLIMANYYNYPKANYDIYRALVDVHKYHHMGEMDAETKKLALFYLKRYKTLNRASNVSANEK